MANITTSASKGILQINKGVLRITVRNSNRINIQKPLPPHYVRAKIEHLVRPKYFEKGERDRWFLPIASQCMKEEEIARLRSSRQEDNPYERLLAKDLRKWFISSKLIAFFHANPIKFDERFDVEVRLRKEDMYLMNYGKHTVEMALEGTPYLTAMPLLRHTDMVFCSEPKVDKLLKVAKKMYKHFLLAAIVEDRLLSVSQLKALSRLEDLTTARAELVGVLNTVQSQLVAGLTYHQSNLVGALQRYADTDTQPDTQPTPPPPAEDT